MLYLRNLHTLFYDYVIYLYNHKIGMIMYEAQNEYQLYDIL